MQDFKRDSLKKMARRVNKCEVDLEIVKQKMLDNELSQAVCNRRIERILKEKYALLNEI